MVRGPASSGFPRRCAAGRFCFPFLRAALAGLAAAVLSLPGVTGVRGAEWRSEADNFAVTFPPDCEEIELPAPTVRVARRSPDQTTIFAVIVDEGAGAGMEGMTEEFARDFERGMFEQASRKIHLKGPRQVAGYPGYEFVGEMSIGGTLVSFHNHITIVAENVYTLQVMDFSGDVRQNREVADFLESFRILEPAKAAAHQARISRSSTSSEAGGRAGTIAVILFVCGAAIAMVVVPLIFWRRSRAQRPPPMPFSRSPK